jgi:ferrochelatase
MAGYKSSKNYDHGSPETLGILLCNLGSPYAPTTKAVRRYLAEFLWDPRVIELPRPLWWLILNGIILRTRPKKSAHAYQSVWTEQGAPLLSISRRQAQALEKKLQGPITVALSMRYGTPSIRAGLDQLRKANARRILVLPLYPQYSATTTASVFDAVVDELKTWRWLPEIRFINHYHDEDSHIAALANSVKEDFQANGRPQQLLFSFHGMPQRYFDEGDPYFCECHKTARLVAEKLDLPKDSWRVTFQSRFGKEEWLKPYTDATLTELPKQGINDVAIICPGFAADCLETLEEIAVENKQVFLSAGGVSYRYIPALNDRQDHIDSLTQLIKKHISGWPESDSDYAESKIVEARSRHYSAFKSHG